MMNQQTLKRLPYGVSDFGDLQTMNRYYVDKTRYIRNIEDKGSFLFFIRPRRFGKSLFLSTLHFYYDIKHKEHFNTFFNGTDIQKNPTPEQNSYLILKLDFSAVTPQIDLVENAFLELIKFEAEIFLTNYQDFLKIDIDVVSKKIESLDSATTVLLLILKYVRIAHQRIYIIIDEYDNFSNTILSTAGIEEYHKITHGEGFLRAFFNVVKSGTSGSPSAIARLFMTGVSPITLDDVTSGFNIATNISLDADINEMVGFNREEVTALIDYYRQSGKIHHSNDELLELMGNWYNQYRFSQDTNQVVFNSVMVLYFMDQYLKNARIPDRLIDDNVRMDYSKLRHLILIDQQGRLETNGNFSQLKEIIEQGEIHAPIISRFPVSQLLDPDNFISLLYYFGLLTITGSDEERNAILAIPNESIKRLYYDYIKETYQETGTFSLKMKQYATLMHGMAFKGEWSPLVNYITQLMAESTGLRDLITGEKVVQAFLNVYLGLTNLYILHSEKEMNKGFADLTMEPFLMQYPAIQYAYLIELKYLKVAPNQTDESFATDGEDKIKTLREEAELQLKQYALDSKFQKTIGQTNLIKLVLIFRGHKLVYSGEVV